MALALGSGISAVVRRLTNTKSLPFVEVPGLSAPSVAGHPGSLTLGDWAGLRVLVFEGRLHHYEGHSWRNIVTPVQTAAFLGARVLLLTNAAGGIHDALTPGRLMAVRDHIEWTRPFCCRLPGPGGIGFDRPSPYSPRLLKLLSQASLRRRSGIAPGHLRRRHRPLLRNPRRNPRPCKPGGADAVGMSTAREIQSGFDAGLECAGRPSCITNRAAGLRARRSTMKKSSSPPPPRPSAWENCWRRLWGRRRLCVAGPRPLPP